MKFNSREKRIISITLACWGLFFVISGLIMNANVKTIVDTKYTLSIESKKIAEAQAKSNEIKLKDFEIEINTPLSVNVKDYLENVDKISASTIKELKLDTSLVTVNQAGSYQYNVIYKKKIYVGKIVVKEKELPTIKVKEEIEIPKGGTLDVSNKSYYLQEKLPDEIMNNIIIDVSNVDLGNIGTYQFYVKYLDTKYTGNIKVVEPISSPATEKTEAPKETTIVIPTTPEQQPTTTDQTNTNTGNETATTNQ